MADTSIDGQILAEITALKNEQVASNRRLPNVMDELKKQNEETAKEVAANQEKTFIALREKIASNDPSNTEEELKKNLSALDALKEEMEATRSQGSLDAYKSQELLDKQIEAQKFAALSPAEQKEANEDGAAEDDKQSKFMQKISGGIGWLVDSGKKVGKAAKLGAVAFLSTLAIGGLLIALGEFLQSDTFKKLTKFISEVIMPKLMEFWEFVKDNWVEIGIVIASFLAAFVIVKAAMLGAKIVKTIQLIGIAFTAVKAFFASTMLPAITGMMVPLLPFIAIAAAIGVVLYALKKAFEDFCKTLNETGSIGEALKVGVAKFIGTIVGFIPMLVLKLVSWVAGMFGFDDFASQVDAIDPIEWITDAVSCLVSDVVDWFIKLFNDPVAAINQLNNLVKGYIGVLIDFAGFIYKKAIKPVIDWVGCLFGVEDASGQMEGYIGKKLDKVINFAEEMYNKYIKPIVDWVTDWFNKAVADAKSSPTGQMISGAIDTAKNFVKTALQTILPDPSGGWTSIEGVAAKAIPKFIYEYAGMDPKTGALSESRSGELPSMRNATKAEKAEFDALSSSPPSKVIANATAMNSDNGSAKVSAMEAAATASVKRDAVGAGGGSGGPINNVDARQSSNVTTTGSSGQSPIIFQKFGKLNMRSSEGV